MESVKAGIWTQHEDTTGRKYFYNMVHGRSYWELPSELMEKICQPMIEKVKEWKGEDAAQQIENIPAVEDLLDEESRRKKEELLLHQQDTAKHPSATAFQERMVHVAQKRADELIKKNGQKQKEEKDQHDPSSQKYLKMVEELKKVDKTTNATSGKWLVR